MQQLTKITQYINIMQYYKGTQQQCQDYDALVSSHQNYHGTTTHWSDVFEINQQYYVVRHLDFLSDMEYVEELPEVLD